LDYLEDEFMRYKEWNYIMGCIKLKIKMERMGMILIELIVIYYLDI